jgi:hypothetical protein
MYVVGEETQVEVPGDESPRYTLRDLKASAQYGVWVRALSLTREGQKSERVIGYPVNNGKKTSQLEFATLRTDDTNKKIDAWIDIYFLTFSL